MKSFIFKDVPILVEKAEKGVKNRFRQYRTEGLVSLNSFKYKSKQSYVGINQINQVIPKIRPGKTLTVEVQKQFVEKYKEIKTHASPKISGLCRAVFQKKSRRIYEQREGQGQWQNS